MQTLLVLYMVTTGCSIPGTSNASRVRSLSPLLESVYRGPLSVEALASAIFGLYTGLVYSHPIGGGLLADRLLGRTRTVTSVPSSWRPGIFSCLRREFSRRAHLPPARVGCFKGNLASQVGALYAIGDNRRADAFQIYYLAVNAGVIAAPLIAGTSGELWLALRLRCGRCRDVDWPNNLSFVADGCRPIHRL